MMKKLLFFMACALSLVLYPMDELRDQAEQYEAQVAQRDQVKPKPLRMNNNGKAEPYYLIAPSYNNRSKCDEMTCLCVGKTAGCLAECCALLEWLMGQREKND